MNILSFFGVLTLAYLIGSVPFGLILVKWRTGEDIRQIGSGRMGGTNAMGAAGYPIGVLTMTLDILKGAAAVWLARWIVPGNVWLEVIAPLAAIIGHNYSIFLIERDEEGRLRLRGGAGGASSLGGAFGLWPPSILIIFPISLILFFGVGYASVTTLSVPVIAAVIFAVRAWQGQSSWVYLIYCLGAEVLLLFSLRPNIRRLINGTERVVGLRARKTKEVKDV
jgi:glycerol-3-phosphate acyltransferase PlsY